jgi:ATP-dependent Clp protease adaptor protein ClpS
MANDPQRGKPQIVLERQVRARRPRLYRVLLHNDDFTTMEFVVLVLMTLFAKTAEQATELMLQVHLRGHAIAGVYPREVAETKVRETTRAAEAAGMPLLATVEPEDTDDAED